MSEESQSLEKPEDAGKGAAGVVKRWMMELEAADKDEKNWRKAADAVVARYRDEEDRTGSAQFNILFSNVETLAPSLYAATPKPDVRRRFRDADPAGKVISEVLERALSFTLDSDDFDSVIQDAIKDVLLPGRAVTRVRYVPTFRDVTSAPSVAGSEAGVEPDAAPSADTNADADAEGQEPAEQPEPEVAFQEVAFDHVDWRDFRRGPGRRWREVPWVAFRHRMRASEIEDQLRVETTGLNFDYAAKVDDEDDTDKDKGPTDAFKRATIWEIWDKGSRTVIWLAMGKEDAPIKVEKDPLRLKEFFPIPRPLYSVSETGSLVPIEEYRAYKDQAEELDRITQRISKIIEVLKVRGIADSRVTALWDLEKAADGTFAAAEDIADLLNNGGLDNAIWMLPTEKIIQVLRELYNQREQVKQTIYEITGISDILRGDSKASETATAQSIKSQWGSLRLKNRQIEVQRYIRDLIRIAAELIAEKFSPLMLHLMTGVPEIVTGITLKDGTEIPVESNDNAEGIMDIMRSDGLRSWRIDIETDSTISGDEESDKQNVTQLLQAVTTYIQGVAPLVQQGVLPMEAAKAILLGAVRRFKLGREVEDALDMLGQPGDDGQPQGQAGQQPEGPDPALQMQQMELQSKQAENDNKAKVIELDAIKVQRQHEMEMAELEAQHQFKMSEHDMRMHELEAKRLNNEQAMGQI